MKRTRLQIVTYYKLYMKIVAICLLLLLLTGCWDFKEITFTFYATSMGVDYDAKEKEFTLYVLLLNFANIAMTEGQGMQEKPSVVGKVKGKSITDAMFELYRSSQLRLYWGHVTSIVLTTEAIKALNMQELTDVINRFSETRYNIWVYAADDTIEKLYNMSPVLGFSPYENMLMNPEDTYEKHSDVKSLYLFKFLADYLEPGRTAWIPILTYTSKVWSEGEKPREQMEITGVHLFHNREYKGRLEYEDIKGQSYFIRGMVRLPLTIYTDGKGQMDFVVSMKDYDINYTFKGGRVIYDLKVDISAYISEMRENVEVKEMMRKLKEEIEKEIRTAFEKGVELQADILNLNDKVFRYDYKNWEKYIKDKPLDEVMELGKVEIRPFLKHSGKYKERVE